MLDSLTGYSSSTFLILMFFSLSFAITSGGTTLSATSQTDLQIKKRETGISSPSPSPTCESSTSGCSPVMSMATATATPSASSSQPRSTTPYSPYPSPSCRPCDKGSKCQQKCKRCKLKQKSCKGCTRCDRKNRKVCKVKAADKKICDNNAKCIPKEVYAQAAAERYYSECSNYCTAEDHCFDRATIMLGTVNKLCKADLCGPNKKWCVAEDVGPMMPSANCDDLAFKIIIRFPEVHEPGDCPKWNYHIATVVKICNIGLVVIDPTGPPNINPTTRCETIQEWANRFAKSRKVVWKDTQERPPEGMVYVELAPGNQAFWDDTTLVDPKEDNDFSRACRSLEKFVWMQCKRGIKPFPRGCRIDSDGDGIPDVYDQCPNSPPGTVVNYCDPKRFGCAVFETPVDGN